MYNRPVFPKIKTIYGEAAASTAVGSISVLSAVDAPCTVQCTTGVIYVSTLSTAPAQADMWRLEEGEKIDLFANNLAIMSTTVASQRQILVYG